MTKQLANEVEERKAQVLAIEILSKKGLENPTRLQKSGALFVARKLISK